MKVRYPVNKVKVDGKSVDISSLHLFKEVETKYVVIMTVYTIPEGQTFPESPSLSLVIGKYDTSEDAMNYITDKLRRLRLNFPRLKGLDSRGIKNWRGIGGHYEDYFVDPKIVNGEKVYPKINVQIWYSIEEEKIE